MSLARRRRRRAGWRPTNLADLIRFLSEHRRVRVKHPQPELCGEAVFEGHRDGGLWFARENGEDAYLPINCGMTPAESGFFFDERGFAVTKFGQTIRYTYVSENLR